MEERFYAEAISKQEGFDDPEVIVFREVWVEEAQEWEPDDLVDRARWNYDVSPKEKSPGAVLKKLGWKIVEDDDWKLGGLGLQANVEPRTE
jgi:hypothetical protein